MPSVRGAVSLIRDIRRHDAFMTPFAQSRNRIAGYTIFDVMVLVAGFAVGGWVSSYFDGGARAWVFWTSSLASGIILWCFIFLWLLPLIRRRRDADASLDGQNNP